MNRKEFENSLKVDRNGEYRKNIKNKPKTLKNYKVRVAAGLAASLVAFGIVGCRDNPKKPEQQLTSTITYTQQLSTEEEVRNEITKIKREFINKYMNEYYKLNKTEDKVNINDINIIVNSQEIFYKADDNGKEVIVTPGRISPELTRNEMKNKYGECEVIEHSGNDKVIQIIGNNGKLFGTYGNGTGTPIYSGGELDELGKDVIELTDSQKIAVKLFGDNGTVELEDLKKEIKDYNNAKKMEEEKER